MTERYAPAAKPGRHSFTLIMDRLWALGPGVITAALVFGPSKITITTKLGADYGFSMLWVIAVAIFFMIIFTGMSARIGIASSRSLLTIIADKWGLVAAKAAGIGIFLVAVSFQAGNSIGIGMAFAELTHTHMRPWIIVFNIIAIGLLFFRSFYGTLEKIMLVLVGLMLFAFVSTLFLSKPGIVQVASGFIPSVPGGSLPLAVAFVASCFSIAGAFYQSYLVQERKRLHPGRVLKDSSATGICLLGLMSVTLLVCAAAILHPAGISVGNATDMAKALEPFFGSYSSILFLCGLFGASFSALMGNASLGGTLLGDAFGYGSHLGAPAVRWLIALVMVIGASIALVFGKLPLQLIIFAQSITILIVPFIGLAMYRVACDKTIMGPLRNSRFIRYAGAIGLILLVVLAFQSIKDLLHLIQNMHR